jgi:Carboxypeptidase regulatory-like domain/TonB dependent receptor-like, beta-barrel
LTPRSRFLRAVLAALAATLCVFAQSSTTELGGQVTDQAGAIVVGAKISLRNAATAEMRQAQADTVGAYLFTQLPPGVYELSVEAQGFRRFVQSGIDLQVGQRARIDPRLTLGAVTESVEVTANAPLLDTADAALGQAVENRKVLDLPMNGRNIVGLAGLATGVVPGNGFGGGIPYGRAALIQAATANLSINGGLTATNDVFMDGVPLSICCQNQIAFLPSIDTTEEFRVRTNMFDAQFGRTGGGVVTYATKSGTNGFHGSAFEFLRNADFDANNFFSNRAGLGIGHYTYNQFGGRFGGPIRHDKLFVFGSYEGVRNRKVNFLSGNVPTAAEAAGQYTVPIFDPLSTTRQGNNFIRTAFGGNQIPQTRLDPVAVKVIKLYPAPNSPVPGSNYLANAAATDVEDQMNLRLDYVVSQNNRLFGRYSYNHNNGDIPDWFHNISSPGNFSQQIRNHNAVLNDTETFSSSLVATFTYGFTRQSNVRAARSLGTDLTEFGWPAAYSAARQASTLPQFSLTGFLGLSSNALFIRNADVQTLGASFDKVRGRHDLKFGFDGRLYQTNWVNNGNAAGSFSFNTGFTRGPDAQTGGGGSVVASMLLGYPATGSLDIVQPFSSPQVYTGLYVQDNFRMSRRLTVNFGLRWDLETARTERYNRLSYFDPNVVSPLAAQAGVPNLKGGLQFLGMNGNSSRQQDNDWNNFGPRVGLAWNATDKLVIRSGYGMVYSPITTRYMNNSNQGFSATTNFLSSTDGGLTPAGTLRDPFPTGISQALGAAPGLLSSIGQSVTTLLRASPVPYVQQWSFSVQRSLRPDLVLEAAYTGSKGTKLAMPIAINNLPSSYLSLGNALLQSVANPFQKYAASGTLSAATVTQSQLLKPFPQFLGITNNTADLGSSNYHAVTLKMEKRFSHGVSVLAVFTGGKLLTDTTPWVTSFLDSAPSWQDVYNRRLDRAVAPEDISKRVVVSYVVELPFGRGKRYLSKGPRALDLTLGGWQLNGITTYQTGQPVVITSSVATTSGATRPNNNGTTAKISGSEHDRLNKWFNTAVFTAPGTFGFGSMPRTLPDLRGGATRNWDVSLFKNFHLTERMQLQLRSEFFNIFNTPRFSAPGGSFATAAFGVVSAQANDPREMQLALRLSF